MSSWFSSSSPRGSHCDYHHRHHHHRFHHQVLSQPRRLPRASVNVEVDSLLCRGRPHSPSSHYCLTQVEENASTNIFCTLHSCFRNRVAIAIELIEEGSIACGQMITTLFFPPLPFLFQVIPLLLVVLLYAVYGQFSWREIFLQALVLGWGGLVAVYLITSSVREYRREEKSYCWHLCRQILIPHQSGDGSERREATVRWSLLCQSWHQCLFSSRWRLHGDLLKFVFYNEFYSFNHETSFFLEMGG